MVMTVGELRKKLDGLDPKMNVAAYREDEAGTHFFDVTEVSVHPGTPVRDERTGKAGLRFSHDGPARWLLITFEGA
jgi:hypothetical protein